MALINQNPLIPAKAGTQIIDLAAGNIGEGQIVASRFVIWIPAFAGTSGEG